MNELITINKTDDQFKVNARELHIFLESRQQFNNWMKNRIETYELIESQDFIINLLKNPVGRPAEIYCLTIDASKELAMVENNNRGKQARKYFIEVEKKFKSAQLPQNYSEALRVLADEVEKKILLENKVIEDTPKVDYYDRHTKAVGDLTFTDAAKEFNLHRDKTFIPWLKMKKYINDNNKAYAKYTVKNGSGWFVIKSGMYNDHRTQHCYITPLGMTKLDMILIKDGLIQSTVKGINGVFL